MTSAVIDWVVWPKDDHVMDRCPYVPLLLSALGLQIASALRITFVHRIFIAVLGLGVIRAVLQARALSTGNGR
jgi:hypothetical protein